MSRLLATSRRLAFGVAALALVGGLTSRARAEPIAYAFATETITNVAATNAAGTARDTNVVLGSPITVGSQTTAALNGVAEFHQDTTLNPNDSLQSYVGTLPRAPENLFTKWATPFAGTSPPPAIPAGTLPTGPGPFSRADELATVNPTGANQGKVVAESLLNTPAGGTAFSHASNQINVPFTVTTDAASNITFTYSYDAYAVTTPGGTVQQDSATFGITIKDITTGVSTTIQNPAAVNTNSPPNGIETFANPTTVTIATPTLRASDQYLLIFNLDANTQLSTAVPEPATMALALTALPLLGFGLLRRRNRNRKAQA